MRGAMRCVRLLAGVRRRNIAREPSERTRERVEWLKSLIASGQLDRASGLLVHDVVDPDGDPHGAECELLLRFELERLVRKRGRGGRFVSHGLTGGRRG